MNEQSSHGVGFWRSRWGISLLAILGAAAFLLTYEHRAHILAGGDWILLALVGGCVLMHLFMHGGHGGGHGHGDRK